MTSRQKYTHLRVLRSNVSLLQSIKRKTDRSITWHVNQAIEKYIEECKNETRKKS